MKFNEINKVIEKTTKILSAINSITISSQILILDGFIDLQSWKSETLLKQYLLIIKYSLISNPKQALQEYLDFVKINEKEQDYQLLKFRVDAELGFIYKKLGKIELALRNFNNATEEWPEGLEEKIKLEVQHEIHPKRNIIFQRIDQIQLGAPIVACYHDQYAYKKKSNIITTLKDLNQIDQAYILDLFINLPDYQNEKLLKTYLLIERAKIALTNNEAIRYYTEALNLCPAAEKNLQDKILVKRGILYYNNKELHLAIKDYNQALTILPTDELWLKAQRLSNLGRFYFKAGDKESSIQNYKKALYMYDKILESDAEETHHKKAYQVKVQIVKFLHKINVSEPESPKSIISVSSHEDSITL